MNHFATACMKKRYSWNKRVNYLKGDSSSNDEDHVQHVSSKHSSDLDRDSRFSDEVGHILGRTSHDRRHPH